MVTVDVNGYVLKMEVDTGAAVSVVSLAVYQKHLSRLSLKEPLLQLSTYTALGSGSTGHYCALSQAV